MPIAALIYIAEHRSEFPGVKAETVPVRRYVNGSVAFHELGYLGEINSTELKAQMPLAASSDSQVR